jgi:hypothetical protein
VRLKRPHLPARERRPPSARLRVLARAFYDVVHQQDLAAFARWLVEADQAGLPELTGVADGLRADRAAVEAGLTLPLEPGSDGRPGEPAEDAQARHVRVGKSAGEPNPGERPRLGGGYLSAG